MLSYLPYTKAVQIRTHNQSEQTAADIPQSARMQRHESAQDSTICLRPFKKARPGSELGAHVGIIA